MSLHYHHDLSRGGVPRRYGVTAVVAVLVVLVAVSIAALRFTGSPSATQKEDDLRSTERAKNLSELQAADQAALTSYGWNDRAKGVVRIPIDRAMDLVIAELNARAPKPGATTTQP